MATVKLTTTKLLPETKRLAKQQAAARGLFLYEYLDKLVRWDVNKPVVTRVDVPPGLDLSRKVIHYETYKIEEKGNDETP